MVVRTVDVLAIPSSILDGSNTSQHVRIGARYIPSLSSITSAETSLVVNLAYFLLYHRAPKSTQASKRCINIAVGLLTFTTVVFRSEVALFLAPLALQLLIQRHTTFLDLVKVGLLAGLTSVGQSSSQSLREMTNQCVSLSDYCLR